MCEELYVVVYVELCTWSYVCEVMCIWRYVCEAVCMWVVCMWECMYVELCECGVV